MTAWQLRRTRAQSSLQALQEFFKALNDRESALAKAKDDESRHAFVEFLNFLEIYSAAYNGGLISGVTREIVEEKIVDSIAVLVAMDHWHAEIERSNTSPTTFKHLMLFNRRHKPTIDARFDFMKRLEVC